GGPRRGRGGGRRGRPGGGRRGGAAPGGGAGRAERDLLLAGAQSRSEIGRRQVRARVGQHHERPRSQRAGAGGPALAHRAGRGHGRRRRGGRQRHRGAGRHEPAHRRGIAVPVILALLVVAFGSGVAVLLRLAVGGIAVLGTFAVLEVLGSVTHVAIYAVNLTTALGLALAIGYALLMVSRYREELAAGREPAQAAVRSVQTAGR